MYYLLEDNRIIDENNMYLKRFRQLKDSGDPDFINADEKETLKNFFGKIKLQGENVFDLIEAGDLVKIDNIAYIVLDTTEKSIIVDRIFGDLHLSKGNINMIYKPNKKGDYIKVWERLNENDR